MQLLPACGLLETIAIEILGLLLCTLEENRLAVVMTDRYENLTRAIPVGTIPQIARLK